MAALLEQLQHVLAAWDMSGDDSSPAAERVGGTLGAIGFSHDFQQKHLFLTSVDGARDGGDTGIDAHVASSHTEEDDPATLDEVEERKAPVLLSSPNVRRRRRQMLTKLELARAALALFTSNAGVYRPVLRKTLGFVFELMDELLAEQSEAAGSGAPAPSPSASPALGVAWRTAESDEVAAVHERMRLAEARMAKLVDEAATQRDHLRAEIAEREERVQRLEGLLRHQMQLSHAMQEVGPSGKKDAQYVRSLIARAEKELCIDDLQKEQEALLLERDERNRRMQSLMDLNGRYAMQSLELAARMSILTDHNISLAIETKQAQNEVLVEKRRTERYQRDLQIARNVIAASFVDRHHSSDDWWTHIHDQRLERSLGESKILQLANSAVKQRRQEQQEREKQSPSQSQSQSQSRSLSRSQQNQAPLDEEQPLPRQTKVGEKSQGESNVSETSDPNLVPVPPAERDDTVCRFWIPSAGQGLDTPVHLRSSTSVEYLRVSPLVAERVVRTLLSAWREAEVDAIRKKKPFPALDTFTLTFLERASSFGEFPSLSSVHTKAISMSDIFTAASPKKRRASQRALRAAAATAASTTATGEDVEVAMKSTLMASFPTAGHSPNAACHEAPSIAVRIAYALDAIARSSNCGALTYAFGLVSRRLVSADLFRMLEHDRLVLLALCRFLDTLRCATGPPTGVIPTAHFAAILSAMYPSYAAERLRQLVEAARHDGGGGGPDSALLLRYAMLLPPRMLPSSAAASVEGSGALWDTSFAHLLASHICDDVSESLRAVEDGLVSVGAVAGEQQMLVKGLRALRGEDGAAWAPALRAAWAAWDELRPERAPVLVKDIPHASTAAAAAHIRRSLLLRRGPRPAAGTPHHALLQALGEQWRATTRMARQAVCATAATHGEYAGGWEPPRLADFVRGVDPRRDLAWGPAEMCQGEWAAAVQHVDASEADISVDELVEQLVKKFPSNQTKQRSGV